MATIKGFSSELAKMIGTSFDIMRKDKKYYDIYYIILKCAAWGDVDREFYASSMSEYLEIRQNLLTNGYKVEKLDWGSDLIAFNVSWK